MLTTCTGLAKLLAFFFWHFIFNWRITALQYWFLPYINMNQPLVYTWLLRLEPPTPPPLACHRALGLSSLHHTACSHWLSRLYMINVYVSVLLSIHPTLSFPVSTYLFSISACSLLPCT